MSKPVRIWVASDHHFQHNNILTFTSSVHGELLRPGFSSIEDHDQHIIDVHNSLVREDDLVYFLGDVTWKTNSRSWEILNSLKGRKRLVLGNHDDANFLHPFFEKTYLWKYFPEYNTIASHVPISKEDLRGKNNIHGHLHEKTVKNVAGADFQYYNVSMERTGYRPLELDKVLKGFV